MDSSTLELIYFISQILAGIAVVISLIYVAIQLKQNTQAVKRESIKNIINTLRDATANLSQSEDKAEILFKAWKSPEELKGAQKFRSYIIFQNLLSAFELAYFEQIDGALEKEHWSGYQQYLIDICKAPGLQEYWSARCTWYRQDFRDYIDKTIMLAPATPQFKMAGMVN